MIKWYQKLYVDNVLEKKKSKVMKQLEQGKVTFDIYCIMFSQSDRDLFDIVNANELLFSYYAKKDILILGIAASKESAIYLVTTMIDEVYRNTKGTDVRQYYQNDQE